ncbi:MAG: YabP/YqfC family sporulation protein [Eubacterium sp.]|nr:YabP/YqfC family sporulation protein [Eubacterium sp.]
MKSREDIIEYATSPHIELVGNHECVVDGLKGILEYTKDRVKVDLGKINAIISGCELSIDSFSKEGAVVCGTIISLEFEGNG